MTAPAPIDDSDSDNDSAASDDRVAVPGGGAGAGSPGAEPVRVGGGERERVPWWRQRRRLFYLAVVVSAIGVLWGGWVWWYRANFPMPPVGWLRSIGINPRPTLAWRQAKHENLLEWKINRETRLLRLAGSAWECNGVKLTFGRDGLVRIRNSDGRPFLQTFFLSTPTPASQEVLAALDGTRYKFQPQTLTFDGTCIHGFLEGSSDSPNLSLPDSPWLGLLVCSSERVIVLYLWPKDESTGLESLFATFTRLPDPD